MMQSIIRRIIKVWRANSGVTAIEYALIAALIAIVIVATITMVGTDLGDILDKFSRELAN